MKHCTIVLSLSLVALLGVGCGGGKTEPPPPPNVPVAATPAPLAQNPDQHAGHDHTIPAGALSVSAPIPALPENPAIEPIGELSEGKIAAFPIMKTSPVGKSALIDLEGPTLLIKDVVIYGGQWTGTAVPDVYSAAILTMKLAENQWTAVRAAKRLAVQPMPGTAVMPAQPLP